MLVLVTYDVRTDSDGGPRRLRRIARLCQNHGQRVQFSVFECSVDPAQWVTLRAALMKEMDTSKDSLRFYFLGANWRGRIEHAGTKLLGSQLAVELSMQAQNRHTILRDR